MKTFKINDLVIDFIRKDGFLNYLSFLMSWENT